MATATLQKWGNGQGVYISRAACEELGISIGDKLDLSVVDGGIRLEPVQRARRTRKLTATELFRDWENNGNRAPGDYPAAGREIDWGAPVGKEAW